MVKRLAVFIFIFVIGSSVLTGPPIYAQKSKMTKCCKSALHSGNSIRRSAANLCCLVNCPPLGAATPPATSVQIIQLVTSAPGFYRFDFQKRLTSPKLAKRLFYTANLFSPDSARLYLRNSAFLI
jgi:hypothetical protein